MNNLDRAVEAILAQEQEPCTFHWLTLLKEWRRRNPGKTEPPPREGLQALARDLRNETIAAQRKAVPHVQTHIRSY